MQTAASNLKAKLITHAIQDPLFKSALASAAADIILASKGAANEATVESAFERILYAVLRDIGLDFHPEKEIPIKTRRHKAHGRTDSRIGAMIVEYKQPSTLANIANQAKAITQLEDYVLALSQQIKSDVVGFLSDGLKVLEIRADRDGGLARGAFQELDGATLNRFVRTIISLQSSALTPENLIKDFCGTAGEGIVFEVARTLNKILSYKSTIKTEMLRTEWESLFRLAHEDQSLQKKIQDRQASLSEIFNFRITEPTTEYSALFSLHTAYAIILKLIAYRVVSDVKFGTALMDFKALTTATPEVMRSFVASLEDGDLFRQVGILNLLEGDFFAWYSDSNQWQDEIADGLRDVLSILARYEDAHSIFVKDHAVDLFRSLYEATIPQPVRSSLGEFYTPYWLAEHVLESSRPVEAWSALDPCCGSGTFVIASIARMRSELAGEQPCDIVRSLTQRICGIDLNPLAVLTARVHFFIHIADLLEDFDEEFAIPIFLGDASNIPTIAPIDGVDFLHYELKTLKTPLIIDIPIDMTANLVEFATVMFEFEKYIKIGDFLAAKQFLLDAASSESSPPIVGQRIGKLADQIIDLEKKEWNGIWARLIANFISTARVGPFTNIIGNPPWIDWKSLPSGYRDKVKSLCVDKGLFSGAGRTGGINLNVCALIAHVAATNWLSKGGRLAFLMPKELANQASYEGWRKSVGGTECALVEFHDWSNAGHPFDPVKEDFMTFILRSETTSDTNIPVFHYRKNERRQKAHEWHTLATAQKYLDVSKGVAGQIIAKSTGYTFADTTSELSKFAKIAGESAYKGREGIEFYPQELLLFKYIKPGPKAGTVWVKNIQASKSKYKVPESQILLETDYLFPLAKGPHLEQLAYDDPDILVVFPYEAADPYAPVPRASLRKKCPLLLSYFDKYKSILEQQTHYSDSLRAAGDFYGLARTGPYSFQDCYVAYRDNSKWHAVVMTKKSMPWGEEKRFLFQNHAVSICEAVDGRYIDFEEANYVCGIYNTPIVAEFIYASSDNRSFKIRAPIRVPLFEKANFMHVRIAELAMEAAKVHAKREANLLEIEKLYLQICS